MNRDTLQDIVRNALDDAHTHTERMLDGKLRDLAASKHTTRDTAIIVVGIILAWDLVKWWVF